MVMHGETANCFPRPSLIKERKKLKKIIVILASIALFTSFFVSCGSTPEPAPKTVDSNIEQSLDEENLSAEEKTTPFPPHQQRMRMLSLILPPKIKKPLKRRNLHDKRPLTQVQTRHFLKNLQKLTLFMMRQKKKQMQVKTPLPTLIKSKNSIRLWSSIRSPWKQKIESMKIILPITTRLLTIRDAIFFPSLMHYCKSLLQQQMSFLNLRQMHTVNLRM